MMPSWLDTCMQEVPVDADGTAHPQRCPCNQVKSCPECTLDCLSGKKWCMFWISKSGKQMRQKYSSELYRDLDKKGYKVFTTIPTPFTACHICMFRLKRPFYSTVLGEYRPFKEVVEDLPF